MGSYEDEEEGETQVMGFTAAIGDSIPSEEYE